MYYNNCAVVVHN